MLNNFMEQQKKHNINELIRLNKFAKKTNNYENKKTKLIKKYNINNVLQKKINDIEQTQEYHNIDDLLQIKPLHSLPNKCEWDFIKNIKPQDNNKALISNLIKNINIVYQYEYLNNETVTGFGDFIRTCYFINQFSEKYNIKVSFHINDHPVKKYLKYFESNELINKIISKNIPFFNKLNYEYVNDNNIIKYKYQNINDILINYLNSLQLYDGNVYLYLINHPNEEYIKDKHREKIAEILQPTDYLNNKVLYAMDCLKLNKGKFKVIHVRIEDECLNNDYAILNSRINYILYILKSVIFETDNDIFLISNNNQLKNAIIQIIPKIKTIFNDITHIAYKNTSEEQIINTLKDFYIMSNSNCIYSFSVYQHGSGFSKWCAVTYNIPYVCYYVS
jgi:hypothetical protein